MRTMEESTSLSKHPLVQDIILESDPDGLYKIQLTQVDNLYIHFDEKTDSWDRDQILTTLLTHLSASDFLVLSVTYSYWNRMHSRKSYGNASVYDPQFKCSTYIVNDQKLEILNKVQVAQHFHTYTGFHHGFAILFKDPNKKLLCTLTNCFGIVNDKT